MAQYRYPVSASALSFRTAPVRGVPDLAILSAAVGLALTALLFGFRFGPEIARAPAAAG
jgi:hypothetical protein